MIFAVLRNTIHGSIEHSRNTLICFAYLHFFFGLFVSERHNDYKNMLGERCEGINEKRGEYKKEEEERTSNAAMG